MTQQGSIGTFVLGMGAQKAGTSWLHTYFQTLDDFHLGFQKEYHILDGLYVPDFPGRKNNRIKEGVEALQEGKFGTKANRKAIKRALFVADPESYFDYFQFLLLRGGGGFTTDMTPSHTALPVSALTKIKREFEARNIHVKVVFLMRDPVERSWSSVRMARRDGELGKRKLEGSGIKVKDLAEVSDAELLKALHTSTGHRLRSDYSSAIKRMEQVFAPEDITYGFFEDLFTEKFIRTLSGRLGFNYGAADFGKQVNVSEKTDEIGEQTRREIAGHFVDTYHFCAQRFGADYIHKIWPNYKYVAL